MVAAIVYAAVIAVLFETRHSGMAFFFMLVFSSSTVIVVAVVGGRLLTMIGVVFYSAGVVVMVEGTHSDALTTFVLLAVGIYAASIVVRGRLLPPIAALVSVAIYSAFIAVMVEGNRSSQAAMVMIAVAICAAIAVRGRLRMMIAAVVSILVYSFFIAAGTNVATGHEEDPFGPHCYGQWLTSLPVGEECT